MIELTETVGYLYRQETDQYFSNKSHTKLTGAVDDKVVIRNQGYLTKYR